MPSDHRKSTVSLRLGIALGSLVLAGCYGGLSDWRDPGGDGGGAGADGDGDGGSDGEPSDAEEACAEDAVPALELRRLTMAEYNATVRDLLGDASGPADGFPGDETFLGFDRNVSSVSSTQVEGYRAAAQTLAEAAATARFDEWITCDRADDACIASFLEWFGRRAYRRPLTSDELDALVSQTAAAREQWGADQALTLTLQSVLMSPYFVYHVELGREGAGHLLTGFEVASRLSYFLWGTMPDDVLLDVASQGELDTQEGVENHARRMLAHERAGEMVVEFGRQWLDLREFDTLERDKQMFPEWTPSLRAAMHRETQTFLTKVLLEGDGRLETLLSAPHSYIDDELAAHYGVEPPAEPFGRTPLPPDERAGLLTQASFLANHAYPSENSWVARGLFVRHRLLCTELPPPPPDVEQNDTNDPDRLNNPECAGCHTLLDPVGWTFDAYGPTGHFDPSVEVSGEIADVEDIGGFESVVELAHKLGQSERVRECFAEQLTFYGAGSVLPHDNCVWEEIHARFAETDYDVRELMVAIATSDAFRFRQE